MDLTDAQWDILREVFVEPRRVDGKGETAAGGACGVEWGVVDLAHRSPLEGLTRSLSTLSNLSPGFSEMAEGWSFRSDFTGAGRGSSAAGKLDLSEGAIDACFAGAKKGLCSW